MKSKARLVGAGTTVVGRQIGAVRDIDDLAAPVSGRLQAIARRLGGHRGAGRSERDAARASGARPGLALIVDVVATPPAPPLPPVPVVVGGLMGGVVPQPGPWARRPANTTASLNDRVMGLLRARQAT
jgi:hypothetical protein